jgi:hypothetical protein
MALPLAAVLVVSIAFHASAQPAPKNPEQLKNELAQDFAKGADVSKLDFSGQPDALVKLLDQAKYVQAGREPGDQKETYILFVRSVARRLFVSMNPAVALYGDRVRPSRSAAAAKEELDARAAIAADVKRNPGISEQKKARVTRDLAQTSAYLQRGMNGDANFIGAPAEAATLTATAVGARGGDPAAQRINWSSLPPQVEPRRLVTYDTPSPAVPAAPLGLASSLAQSWESLKSYINWEEGKTVAVEAYTGTLNYVKSIGKMCWQFVKQAFIDSDVLDVPNPQSTGLLGIRPGAAAMFAEDVKKNPKILDRMHYRRVDLAHVSDDPSTVPDGSLLIYARGCSFANAQSGHAELTLGEATYQSLHASNRRLPAIPVSGNEVRVCHFACTKRSMPFLRTYGKQGCLNMYVPVKST